MSIAEQIDYKTLTQGLIDSEKWRTAAARVSDDVLRKAIAEVNDPILLEALCETLNQRHAPASDETPSIWADDVVSAENMPVRQALITADQSGGNAELVDEEGGATELLIGDDEQERLRAANLAGQFIGRRQMGAAISKLITVNQLLEIQKIQESKSYKGLAIEVEPTKWLTVNTFAQFCQHVIGKPLSSVKLDLYNLAALGSDFVESMQSIGIGPGTMRSLRQIPPEERGELEAAAKQASREEFIELAETLIEKHSKEKASLTKRAEEAETQLNASRGRVEKLTQQVYALEDEKSAGKLTAPDPDDETLRLRKELADFLWTQKAAIQSATNSGIKQLLDHGDARHEDHREFVSGLLVEIEREINILRDLFNIPAAPSASTLPEWAAGLPQDFEGMES